MITWINLLVGGLEHFLFSHIFPYIALLIIPTDVHIFQKGGPATNQLDIVALAFSTRRENHEKTTITNDPGEMIVVMIVVISWWCDGTWWNMMEPLEKWRAVFLFQGVQLGSAELQDITSYRCVISHVFCFSAVGILLQISFSTCLSSLFSALATELVRVWMISSSCEWIAQVGPIRDGPWKSPGGWDYHGKDATRFFFNVHGDSLGCYRFKQSLVGGNWLPSIWHFPRNTGLLSSSQLTHIFQRGFSPGPPTRSGWGWLGWPAPDWTFFVGPGKNPSANGPFIVDYFPFQTQWFVIYNIYIYVYI